MKLDEITSSNAFSNAIMLVIMVNVVLWLGSWETTVAAVATEGPVILEPMMVESSVLSVLW